MYELLARAYLRKRSPALVYMAMHSRWPLSVSTTSLVIPSTGLVIAQTDSALLSHWLVNGINALLDRGACISPVPPGEIRRQGLFAVEDDNLFAWSSQWSWSRGSLQVARRTPLSLAEQLNELFILPALSTPVQQANP